MFEPKVVRSECMVSITDIDMINRCGLNRFYIMAKRGMKQKAATAREKACCSQKESKEVKKGSWGRKRE